MSHLHFLDPNPDGMVPVLLLHGMGASGESWSLQFPALIESGFRPLAPDVPGFGQSPICGKTWTVGEAAAEIMHALQEMNSGTVHVVGLSMGGVIAQQIARDFPLQTRKLVLVSTFARLQPDSISGWFYFLRRAMALAMRGMPAQAAVVARRVFPHPEQELLREMLEENILRSDPHAYRRAMLALGRFDSSKWLGQLKQPVMVVTGNRDTTVSPKLQQKLVEKIPGARHIIIEGGGHAVPVDQADQFNQLLLEFLHE